MQALTLAKKVIIVPGYGLAVASAQATVADLVSSLRKNGVDVKWAPHCFKLLCMVAHTCLHLYQPSRLVDMRVSSCTFVMFSAFLQVWHSSGRWPDARPAQRVVGRGKSPTSMMAYIQHC